MYINTFAGYPNPHCTRQTLAMRTSKKSEDKINCKLIVVDTSPKYILGGAAYLSQKKKK